MSGSSDQEWPDYTPLQEVVVDADGMLALDFPVQVGARPYVTFEDGEWSGVSVGPFDQTEDGETILTTKEIDVDGEKVAEMLEGARLVNLRSTRDTPIEGYDDLVYHSLEDIEPLEETGSDENHCGICGDQYMDCDLFPIDYEKVDFEVICRICLSNIGVRAKRLLPGEEGDQESGRDA